MVALSSYVAIRSERNLLKANICTVQALDAKGALQISMTYLSEGGRTSICISTGRGCSWLLLEAGALLA